MPPPMSSNATKMITARPSDLGWRPKTPEVYISREVRGKTTPHNQSEPANTCSPRPEAHHGNHLEHRARRARQAPMGFSKTTAEEGFALHAATRPGPRSTTVAGTGCAPQSPSRQWIH